MPNSQFLPKRRVYGQTFSRGPPTSVMLVAKAFQKPNPPRTRYETEALLDSGYGVYVFAWDRGSEFPSLENVDGTIVRSFSLARIRKLSGVALMFGGILFQIWLGFQTVKLIGRLKQRPIIHAHDINTLFPGYLIKTLGLSSALIYDCRIDIWCIL